jgi:hypothetical protein
MKNALFMFAVFAAAGIAAAACPASLREQVVEQARIPASVQIEAERQVDLFVSWVRDDAARPGPEFGNQNLD